MESLIELCDLIAEKPEQFADKLVWICGRCPSAESLLTGSPRVSRSQLNAVLAAARFLSKCPNYDDQRPKSLLLAFYRAIPSSFTPSFWPQSFGNDAIASFFNDYFAYMCRAAESASDFATDIAGFTGEIVISATGNVSGDLGISRVFLNALALNFPPILSSDANRLVSCLLERLEIMVPNSPRELISSEAASSQSSPLSLNHFPYHSNERASPGNEVSNASGSSGSVADDASSSKGIVTNGGSAGWKSNVDILNVSTGLNDGGGGKGILISFEQESLENLEKQEIAFKLIRHILDKATVDSKLLEQVRLVTKEQLQSMLAFLKIRKRDWSEQGHLLKARVSTKLSVYQAVAKLQIKILASVDLDGKSSKRFLHGTLALLIEAAEACLFSVWRKLRICEELFGSLLGGISQAAVARVGQLLRVLLIRFKPLVLTTCIQADTWGSSQGAMFQSVLKATCEIIEYGWIKERPPVDTFITGLATSFRERKDYEEELQQSHDAKDKQAASAGQLNMIRLLADLNVSVNKPEVVDLILPLFIESLEEGDASAPGLLRLQLLDAVSRLASLGFEKSYREAVVLLIRSYLSKLSAVGSAESKTVAPEATTERVETLPAGFLVIAGGLTDTKLRSDFRHRLLSLCSDVGLAAESKSGRSGADFLGPLLPAVAEICSDFDPTINVEPSLLKLFRNLWFYIALFGLAPPIQKGQVTTKSVSTSLNSVGSMGVIAVQAVGGPYMWNAQWASAVQRISQGTPPLVVSSVKWLEDELELNALHNPGSRRGSGNEKAAVSQRSALSAALGGRVEVSGMGTISGVKATYLLAVAFLEIIRFSSNGGMLNGSPNSTASRSAFSCVFEYLKSPNLMPAVSQCLTAIVHRAFETAILWLDERASETGHDAESRESALSIHACFLIKNLSQRDEHIRDISVTLLNQLRDKFPQILWNSSCLDSLLFSIHNDLPSAAVHDPAWVATVRSLYQKIVREWIVISLSYAPCTSQGLLQSGNLGLRALWLILHFAVTIWYFLLGVVQSFESFLIASDILTKYEALDISKVRYLAMVIDSEEAQELSKVLELLQWVADIGVKSVCLYDPEGVLKNNKEPIMQRFSSANLSEEAAVNGRLVTRRNLTLEFVSFEDGKEAVAKAANYLFVKHYANGTKEKSDFTEPQMAEALGAIGSGGAEPDLLLIYGPTRCHLGFPAWRLRYTEIVHMGPLKSMSYGSLVKAIFKYTMVHQNYETTDALVAVPSCGQKFETSFHPPPFGIKENYHVIHLHFHLFTLFGEFNLMKNGS